MSMSKDVLPHGYAQSRKSDLGFGEVELSVRLLPFSEWIRRNWGLSLDFEDIEKGERDDGRRKIWKSEDTLRKEEDLGNLLVMEQQEEKTENINTKRRKQSPSSSKLSSSSIPLDLTLEILSKLPVESVMRFRCVSKVWSSITTDPYFISSFKTRPRLLMFYRKGAKLFVFSLSQNPNKNEGFSYSSSQPIDSYHITYPENCCVSDSTESVHGLICFQISTNPIIWSPSMRQFLTIRKPQVESWKETTVFLGYDPNVGNHKLVCMSSLKTCDHCRVLTLGSDEKSWRMVKTEHTHRPFNGHGTGFNGRCINGVLYYQAICGYHRFIMSFDVSSETSSVITCPWGGDYKVWKMLMMISYEGKLAFVGNIRSGKRICGFWRMQ
ncbi:hypothetical protein Bca101_043592 [Brassica carinata]